MLIHQLTLQGILSFPPEAMPLEMRSLNVLIGPNGSGKSNLLEAVSLLRSAPAKLAVPTRGHGGGVKEWIWKGASNNDAQVEVIVDYPPGTEPLRHRIRFSEVDSRFELLEEVVEYHSIPRSDPFAPLFSYRLENGVSKLTDPSGVATTLSLKVARNQSILSQYKDPIQFPELTYLGDQYDKIRVYREWSIGRSSVLRRPQAADLPSDRLEEDFSNLGLYLNHLRSVPKAKNAILSRLRDLYEEIDDFDVRVRGGTVEVFLTERDFIIPASRLSDGTLRYLCLLAILCDPDPPELICIEEPELGLHPDLIPKIADLLIEASERTQLIVTTHSDILVDAMSEQPDSIVVVEKHDGKTELNRLQGNEELKEWLAKYRLGQLWTRGVIGGTRW